MKREYTLIDSATAVAGGGTAEGSFTGEIPNDGQWDYKLFVVGDSNSGDVDIDVTKQIASSSSDFSEISKSNVDLSTVDVMEVLDIQEAERLDIILTNNEASTGTDDVVSAYLVIQET